MSEQIRTRVLVALDFGEPGSEALQWLPQLLDSERLELTGLYVEDEDLMRAARLPGLREISLSGQAVELSPEQVERDMAADVSRIRGAFEHAARGLRLRYRFEVMRGRLAEALCVAALQSDFVLISRTLRGSGLRPRTAPHFGPLLKQSRRVLLVNEPWSSGSTVIVLGDDPEAIAAGARLATAETLQLVVALPRSTDVPTHLPPGCIVVRLPDWSEDAIVDLCLRRDARLLITDGNDLHDTAERLTGLMDRLPCSLLKLG